MSEGKKTVKVKANASCARKGVSEPSSHGGFVFDVSVGTVDGESGLSSSDFVLLVLVVQFDAEHLGQAVTNLRCRHIDNNLSKPGHGINKAQKRRARLEMNLGSGTNWPGYIVAWDAGRVYAPCRQAR